MSERELLEAEVKRITSLPGKLVVITRPDASELKFHIRAISADDLTESTDTIALLVRAIAVVAKKLQTLDETLADEEKAAAFDDALADAAMTFKDRLLDFLPWLFKSGTDITYDEVRKLDYLIVSEVVIEIIKHNFGKRLLDFFLSASSAITPLMKTETPEALTDGLSPKASSVAEDMAKTVSGSGASEN